MRVRVKHASQTYQCCSQFHKQLKDKLAINKSTQDAMKY